MPKLPRFRATQKICLAVYVVAAMQTPLQGDAMFANTRTDYFTRIQTVDARIAALAREHRTVRAVRRSDRMQADTNRRDEHLQTRQTARRPDRMQGVGSISDVDRQWPAPAVTVQHTVLTSPNNIKCNNYRSLKWREETVDC